MIGNSTGYVIDADVKTSIDCGPYSGGQHYTAVIEEHVTLRSGGTFTLEASCNAGDWAWQSASTFSRLYSDAPDRVDLCADTNNAKITSDVDNNTSPDGTLLFCDGSTFRNKRRDHYAGAMFTANGTEPYYVGMLGMLVECSGGGSFEKKWSPGSIQVGQTATSTVSCPEGETVLRSTASFTELDLR